MFETILIAVISTIIILGAMIWLVGERGKLLMPSTRKFIKEGGIRRFLSFSTLHGYIYMRWQKPYLGLFINQIGPHSSQSSRKWWSNQYHSKVLTEHQAKTIITINENIPYQDLEQVIPYPIARKIILSASPKITVYECGCRLARQNPCTPTQVCMFIGEPFASFMLEHHPTESKALSQSEALELLRAEHERGHIHTAWFKNAMHDRFYVICNCCKCCCGGIETMNKYGIPMLSSSGYVAKPDEILCTACGTCLDFCPFGALSLDNYSVVDWNKCMGCGVCVDQCPNDALSLIQDERKGIPLDVKTLSAHKVM
jgi:Pyruvate/2-oxoacid:ferredoxin oxidoreductase delta subunit